MDDNVCKKCAGVNAKIEWQIFENGTKHLRATCLTCGEFMGFVRQNQAKPDFEMPFGKCKGEKLTTIWDTDPDYLFWAKDNLSDGNVKRRIVDFLKSVSA